MCQTQMCHESHYGVRCKDSLGNANNLYACIYDISAKFMKHIIKLGNDFVVSADLYLLDIQPNSSLIRVQWDSF